MSGVTTLRSHIDHIVVTAPSLEIGVEYVRDALGVTPEIGGEHPRMGTHNCLLRLGDSLYLEVISINPAAGNPDCPRWFQLDLERSNAAPRLATWISRTNDIRAATAASPIPLGNIEAMSRGPFNWQITIPANGTLPLDGVVPTLIEWEPDSHPARTLKDLGCTLVRLEGFHRQSEAILSMLQSIGFQGQFTANPISQQESPFLIAHVQTPGGVRQLRSS
ncbi:MAG TPA: VOC family protein [Burkholderiales bacterium]|nr:VOC family protein [Burkholderiales bacterium]